MRRGLSTALALVLAASRAAAQGAPGGAIGEQPPPSASPAPTAAPAASTSTVSASTATVSASTAAVSASTSAVSGSTSTAAGAEAPHVPIAIPVTPGEGGAGVLPEEPAAPPPPITKPLRVKTHKEAKDWEPVSVRFGGVPEEVKTAFSRRVVVRKVKGKKVQKGEASKLAAVARVYSAGGVDRTIVVSLYPDSLRKEKRHFEVRLKIVEGFLEGAQVAAVTIEDPELAAGRKDDSVTLRRKSLPFREEFPSSAELKLSAVDAAPGKNSANAGIISGAEFGGRELGFVTARYFIRGVSAGDASLLPPKPAKKKKARKKR